MNQLPSNGNGHKTPPRGFDWGAFDFSQPEMIRDAFVARERIIDDRIGELMTVMEGFQKTLNESRKDSFDMGQLILADLAKIIGDNQVRDELQARWIALSAVLREEQSTPKDRLIALEAAEEQRKQKRDAAIERLLVRSRPPPADLSPVEMVEQIFSAAKFVTKQIDAERERISEIGLEDARDEADKIIARERRAEEVRQAAEAAERKRLALVKAEADEKLARDERRHRLAVRLQILGAIVVPILLVILAWYLHR